MSCQSSTTSCADACVGVPTRTLSVSFDIVTEAPKDHFEECLVDALSYLIDMIDPDHVIVLHESTLKVNPKP